MIAFFISSLRCAALLAQRRHAIDHVDDQVKADVSFSIASSSGVLMLPFSL